MTAAAAELVDSILEEHKPTPLSSSASAAIDAIVNKAESSVRNRA